MNIKCRKECFTKHCILRDAFGVFELIVYEVT